MKNDILVIRDLIDKAVREHGIKAVRTTIKSILDFYEPDHGSALKEREEN